MIVAVFGSRKWRDLERVDRWIAKLAEKHPDAIVMSGGAPGVDQRAERASEKAGLRVASLRPESRVRWVAKPRPQSVWVEDPDEPSMEEWELLRRRQEAERAYDALVQSSLNEFVVVLYETTPGEPQVAKLLPVVYESFKAAALARDTMFAELADQGAAFWAGKSSGTGFTISEFGRLEKSDRLTVYET